MPAAPRRSGLGRGLSALIPGGPEAHELDEIPVAQIRPNPHQPRAAFGETALQALTESIKSVGMLQPVLVRPQGAGYELVAGERRWRAAQRAGLSTIPALVRHTEDASILEHALIENLHRENLNPLEEAAAYQQLIEDFGLTHEEVGQRLGRSRSAVSNSLRLLSLPASLHQHLVSGALSAGHARALLALEDARAQQDLAVAVVREGWSVRATEAAVSRRLAGEGGATPTPAPARQGRGLLEVESSLADYLETRVRVEQRQARGRIVIDFATTEDLARIWRLIVGRPSN